LQNRGDLWNLLGTIAAHKARQHMRRENAAKRGGGTVVGEGALRGPDGSPLPLDEVAPTADAAEVDLHCEELLGMLDPELREFALLRHFGYTNAEIAVRHRCTERRIERKMNLIRLRWQHVLPGGTGV